MLDDSQLPTQPDTMICFALYTASHAINRAYVPLLKDLGLTYPQWITLMFLWEQNNQSVGDLSAKLQMQTNTLTPLLKRLETLGHITRTRNPKDERQVIIRLTQSGRDMQNHASAVTRCVIEATGFDLPMLDNLVKVLSTLRDQVSAAD
jgi:DNA-binding MarR family transcriptional regulator